MAEGREQAPAYRCNCGQTFPSHLARAAHAASCPVMTCTCEASPGLPDDADCDCACCLAWLAAHP